MTKGACELLTGPSTYICQDSDRKAEFCIELYKPVCGTLSDST